MAVEKIISNHYSIFKLAKDELNWTYVADGPLMQNPTNHGPWSTRHIDLFAKNTLEDHMDYLESKGCAPRHCAYGFVSFSYDLPYESALVNRDEIWRAQKLSDEEKALFEKHISQFSRRFWDEHSPLPE